MSPPVEAFHPRRLETHVQYTPNGHKRKQPVDLQKCQLRELIQYNCELDGPPSNRKSRVVCDPVLRLFRKCADGLTVEVTSFEGIYDQEPETQVTK